MSRVPISERALFHFRRTLRVELAQEALRLEAEGDLRDLAALGSEPGYAHAWGIPVEHLERRALAWRQKYKTLRITTCCRLIDALVEDGRREELLVGILLLASFGKRLDTTVWPHLQRWIDRLDATEALTLLAESVIAPLSARDSELRQTLAAWKSSACTARRHVAESIAICRGG